MTQPPQGQPPYGPPPPPYPPYGWAPYGWPPPYGHRPPPPTHREASKAMTLGLISIVGGVMCYLPIFVSPVAWVVGTRVLREIDASEGRLGGRSEAQVGRIMGIIGTVLLGLGLAVIVLLIVLGVSGVFDEGSGSNV